MNGIRCSNRRRQTVHAAVPAEASIESIRPVNSSMAIKRAGGSTGASPRYRPSAPTRGPRRGARIRLAQRQTPRVFARTTLFGLGASKHPVGRARAWARWSRPGWMALVPTPLLPPRLEVRECVHLQDDTSKGDPNIASVSGTRSPWRSRRSTAKPSFGVIAASWEDTGALEGINVVRSENVGGCHYMASVRSMMCVPFVNGRPPPSPKELGGDLSVFCSIFGERVLVRQAQIDAFRMLARWLCRKPQDARRRAGNVATDHDAVERRFTAE